MRSISRRLVVSLIVPLTVLGVCGAVFDYYNDVYYERARRRQMLETIGVEIASALNGNKKNISDALVSVIPVLEAGSVRYAIRDEARHLIAGDADLPVESLSTKKWQHKNLLVDGHEIDSVQFRTNTKLGVLTTTVIDVDIGSSRAINFKFGGSVLWDFVQLDITLALVWFGVQRGLLPLRRLSSEIETRSPRDLQPVDASSAPSELRPLLTALNQLFVMMQAAVRTQHAFIANAAHQLRTPIAGVQAQIDVLINDANGNDAFTERLAILRGAVQHLTRSANQLLTLAKAEPTSNMGVEIEEVKLDALVRDVTTLFVDRADALSIDLGVETKPSIALANEALLEDLLNNLIDNALKYTPAQGQVTVSCGEENGASFIKVEDNGPGIPEAERMRVRQRFYRLPNSVGDGSGLGLAIVEEIAGLYDGVVQIGSGPDGVGTSVKVQFKVRR